MQDSSEGDPAAAPIFPSFSPRKPRVRFFALPALVLTFSLALTACSADLPGLRVLRGETDPQTLAEQAVEVGDLVMADKSGSADPVLLAAADRIEAAAFGSLDVVEMRDHFDQRAFDVFMLLRLSPQTTQAEFVDTLRRAAEVTWLGTMRASGDTDLLHLVLLAPQEINTLDNGESFFGQVIAELNIERNAALAYLQGERSLSTFVGLIADGTLSYNSPTEFVIYEGTPNHPIFMLQPMAAGS